MIAVADYLRERAEKRGRGRPKKPLMKIFMEKVEIEGLPDYDAADVILCSLLEPEECPKEFIDAHWIWTGAVLKSEPSRKQSASMDAKEIRLTNPGIRCYPVVQRDGRPASARKLFFDLLQIPYDPKGRIMTRCGDLRCINPWHCTFPGAEDAPELPEVAVEGMDQEEVEDCVAEIRRQYLNREHPPRDIDELHTWPTLQYFERAVLVAAARILKLNLGE